MTPAIEVRDLVKSYRVYHERNRSLKSVLLQGRRARFEEFNAVDDVSFDVPPGSTFGLLGENGSGKSTLLKCVARILRPDSGTIRVNGRMSALLELGAGFHPELTGRENVYLNGAILGLTKREIDARFDSIVDFAGLSRFIDNPVKNYSSGMYVRLGFSVAIHIEPEVLLVDEVLAVGDQEFQDRCAMKFADLKRQGCTIVLVTHSMGTVERMCDSALWMHHGRAMTTGPSNEVVEAYLDHVNETRRGWVQEQSVITGVDGRTVRPVIGTIELIGPDGRPTHRVGTLEPVRFRFTYRARDLSVDVRPILRIGRSDGVWVANVNAAAPVPFVHDDLVRVEYDIPSLPLLPGQYEFGIELRDKWLINSFVQVDRAVSFEVVGPPGMHESGIVHLRGDWSSEVVERMPEAPAGTT